jgi:alcohol dehydrogenase (NADP+)
MEFSSINTPEPIDTLCLCAYDESCKFSVSKFKRRAMSEYDVVIKMKYCGICHSDIHSAASQLMKKADYPITPGHELAGVAVAVGSKVTRVKVGDHVGVGCMVDACLECDRCKEGNEHKCKKGMVGTYGGKDKHGRAKPFPEDSSIMGGYTSIHVVHERFAVIIPKSYDLKYAGPVMCAGITMYDPLKVQGVTKGTNVGIVGLGGLGEMGIKIANVMGANVYAISRSPGKKDYAIKCGASQFIVSTNLNDVKANQGKLDLILNTVPFYHDYTFYKQLLKRTGKQVILGLHAGIGAGMIVPKISCCKSRLIMSGIGGMKNTQEVMDICAENQIYPEIKVIPVWEVNQVYHMLDSNNKTGLRYVLDLENTLNEGAIDKVKNAEAPNLKPSRTNMSLPKILKEVCWVLCCCKHL